MKGIKFLVVIVALITTFDSSAQTTPKGGLMLSLGAQVGLPTGNAVGGTTFILGGDLKFHYGLTEKLALTFTTGGYHFFPVNDGRESFGIGPLKGGVKYFVVENIYIAGELGAGVEVTPAGFEGGHTKFLWSPGAGYATDRWDFGIRYEDYSGKDGSGKNFGYGQFALRVGYGLRLNKK